MKKDDLKNKTAGKLKSDLKSLQGVTWVLSATLILLVSVNIYGLLFKENKATFIALMAVAAGVSAVLPSLLGNIKSIKTELQSRESANV